MILFRLSRIAAFLVVLGLPLATMQWQGGILGSENRSRAPMPDIDAVGAKFPEEFDAFFRDSFGLREFLIRRHHLLQLRYLRESPMVNVILGSDGWMFHGGYGDGIDVRDFAGRWPHPPGQVDGWVSHQERRRVEYEQLGARYLIVIVPNKQSVYPEKMPLRYGPHAPGVLDELIARARAGSKLEILDLRETLQRDHDDRLFFRTDTHWTARGAFFAAQALADRVRPWFPAVAPLRHEDYEVVAQQGAGEVAGGDLARMLKIEPEAVGAESFVYRRRDGRAPVKTEISRQNHVWAGIDPASPRVVLLGDSFGGALAERLADVFARVNYLNSVAAGYDPQLVAKEKPDLVVLVLIERYMTYLASQ